MSSMRQIGTLLDPQRRSRLWVRCGECAQPTICTQGMITPPHASPTRRYGMSRVVEELGGVQSVTVTGLQDKPARGTLTIFV